MFFLDLFKTNRNRFVLAFLCIVVTHILGLALPWCLKIIFDDVLTQRHAESLAPICWVLVALLSLRAVAVYWGTYLSLAAAEQAVAGLRSKLYEHLLRLSVLSVGTMSTGNLISRVIGDTDSVKRFLFSGILDFFYSFLNALFVIVILFWMDWKLAALVTLFLPVFILSYFRLGRKLKTNYEDLLDRQGLLSGRLGQTLRGIRTVHALERRQYESERFAQGQNEIVRKAAGVYRVDARFGAVTELLSGLGLVLILWVGSGRVLSAQMSAGTLMAFYTYIGLLFMPLLKIATVNGVYQEARASMERVRRLLEQPEGPRTARTPLALPPMTGRILFEDVGFSYEGTRRAVSGVCLEVSAGQTLALVGPSGAGKTTLVGLLARFMDPCQGRILIDGCDLKRLNLEEYRAKIAVVLQEDFLFNDTVRENIAYGNPGADEAALVLAAKAANAHDFIMGLPQQYQTPLGEAGAGLSGGQRQRLAIARALLRDPSILILDEATSAVDSAMDETLAADIQRIMKGRTTLVIAHRLSTVRRADKIAVLEDGRISASGTHEELISRSAVYRDFCRIQSQTARSAGPSVMASDAS